MNRNGYVIVEGNIGAGKSLFSRLLVENFKALKLDAEYLPEPDETNNPFLPLYYKDPHRWAYTMQTHLLGKRYEMTQYAQHGALSEKGWFIMDRSYFGDLYFAAVQMKDNFFTPDEFNSYINLHKAMQANIHFPTACIFLDCSPEICKTRIEKRMSEKAGRACESSISLDYLSSLQTEIYKLAMFMSTQTRTIHIPWNKDRSEFEISLEAYEVALKLTENNETRTDFYSPWGACASALFVDCKK